LAAVGARIDVDDDVAAINKWLAGFADSSNTQASYAREANRFLIWWQHAQGSGARLGSVLPDDTRTYAEFLASPDPHFIAKAGAQRQGWEIGHDKLLDASSLEDWQGRVIALHAEGWRPFRRALGLASRYQSQIVLFAMYAWLKKARYVEDNPFDLYGLSRRGIAASDRTAIGSEARRALVTFVLDRADEGADAKSKLAPYAKRAAARDLWLITIVLLTGARRIEIARASMGDIFMAADGWVWRIHAKGGTDQDVPVTDEFIAGLARYRKAHGLAPDPSTDGPDAILPLVADVRERTSGTHYRLNPSSVNAIVQSLADKVVDARKRAGADHNDDVNRQLGGLVLHGLRHTAATGMVEAGASLKDVQDLLRHRSIQTTMNYVHSVERAKQRERLSKFTLLGELKPS